PLGAVWRSWRAVSRCRDSSISREIDRCESTPATMEVMTSAAYRRYAADGALVLGGLAAILLQVADPVVGRGVAEHSAFATDPMRRLRHTLTFVYAVTLGTPAQRERAASFVDRAHTGVPGATDVERQLWVAATLVRVGTQVHE